MDQKKLEKDIEKLKSMTVVQWGQYAFSRDPIGRKISQEQKEVYIKKANQCGKEQAFRLIKKQQDQKGSVWDMAAQLGIVINKEASAGSDDYIVFAKYNYPKTITLYMKNVIDLNAFIEAHGLSDLLGAIKIEEILLAHELYHFCEEHFPNVYSKIEKFTLWKIGPFKYKTGVIAIREIAAMSFAQTLLGLPYSPYLFDSLLLLPHDKEKAVKLMADILNG